MERPAIHPFEAQKAPMMRCWFVADLLMSAKQARNRNAHKATNILNVVSPSRVREQVDTVQLYRDGKLPSSTYSTVLQYICRSTLVLQYSTVRASRVVDVAWRRLCHHTAVL